MMSKSQRRPEPTLTPGGMHDQQDALQQQFSIRPANAPRTYRRNLLLDLPIAWRLAVGFLIAALIAAVAAGIPAVQQVQSLGREANFYSSLLQSNTTLTTGKTYLELMNSEALQTVADANAPVPSHETLADDQKAVTALETGFDTTLSGYVTSQLLALHPDQVTLLSEANHALQVAQQRTLASSVSRTWQVYRQAQDQVLQDIAAGNIEEATALEHKQGEPTYADAQSALRALLQFSQRLAGSVHDFANIKQQDQLFTALAAALLAFLGVGAAGWIISNTLVRRLQNLRRVTQLVEQGTVDARVEVVGRDEIGGVSASVNGMLNTIVGLLDVTRRQRDALTNAAQRLFTDVRVAGAGDLRVNAAVSSDPIGMLANAFNFTIGRFRRFVLRTQTAVDQLDIIGRQEIDRAEAFLTAAQRFVHASATGSSMPSQPSSTGQRIDYGYGFGYTAPREPEAGHVAAATGSLVTQIDRGRELLRQTAQEGANQHARATLDFAEQAYLSAGRLSQLVMSLATQRTSGGEAVDALIQGQMEELRTLGALLARLGNEAHTLQKGAGTNLKELDGLLEQIGRTVRETPQIRGGSPNSAPTMGTAQVFELVRLSSGFAQDVASLARQIAAITQEMRSGVAPFRLENSEDDPSMLYAPGTGYNNEPVGYGAFGQGRMPYSNSAPSSPLSMPNPLSNSGPGVGQMRWDR